MVSNMAKVTSLRLNIGGFLYEYILGYHTSDDVYGDIFPYIPMPK